MTFNHTLVQFLLLLFLTLQASPVFAESEKTGMKKACIMFEESGAFKQSNEWDIRFKLAYQWAFRAIKNKQIKRFLFALDAMTLEQKPAFTMKLARRVGLKRCRFAEHMKTYANLEKKLQIRRKRAQTQAKKKKRTQPPVRRVKRTPFFLTPLGRIVKKEMKVRRKDFQRCRKQLRWITSKHPAWYTLVMTIQPNGRVSQLRVPDFRRNTRIVRCYQKLGKTLRFPVWPAKKTKTLKVPVILEWNRMTRAL